MAGCGQQLVMSQEIYFCGHGDYSLEYPGVYLDIQTELLLSIMRKTAARGILSIRHERAFMAGCLVAAGTAV